MSANMICRSCLRVLRQTTRVEATPSLTAFTRALSTTTSSLSAPKSKSANEPSTSSSPAQTTRPASDASTMAKFAARMRAQSAMQAATEPYVAYRSTAELFKSCTLASDYSMPALKDGEEKLTTSKGEEIGTPAPGTWFADYDILPTFNAWAQITFLHMYLLTVRLRMFPAEHAKHWHQNLLDHFFYAAEDRMAVFHGIEARMVRNKYLKDLFVQWRGVLAGYDEGLIKGDAELATAVWRNVFGGREDVDAVALAEVVGWMRVTLRSLERMGDAEVAAGRVQFAHPKKIGGTVAKNS